MDITNKNIYIVGEFEFDSRLLGSTLFVDCSVLLVKPVNYIETAIILNKDKMEKLFYE